MPVAGIRAHDNWSQFYAGMRVSKNEMAGSEFQMHRKPRDLILPRNDVGFDDPGMLLKSELKKVSYGGVLHRHIDSLLWGLNKTELALAGVDLVGWRIIKKKTKCYAKMWINIISRPRLYPQ